jgi:hypothetical protein
VSRRAAARAIGGLAAAALGLGLPRPAGAQPEDPAAPAPPPPAPPADPSGPSVEPAIPPPAPPAAPASPPSLDEVVDVFDDRNRVPENPAIDVLDATGLGVVKPGSTKDLATDFRALYAGGKVVPQVALELSPYALAYGNRTTYEDYARRAYVPILHRLHVSFATTSAGSGADQATLGAIGVRVRLIDRSDWRLDKAAVSCALDAAQLAKPPSKPGDRVVVVVDAAPPPAELRKVQACFDEARKRRGSWNATQLAVGAAASSAFPGGKLQRDLRDLTAWIGWGNRLGQRAHLVTAARYTFGDTRRDGEVRLPARHIAAVAAQVEHRSDRFGLLGSLGAGLRWSDDAAATRWVRTWVGQLGGEVQVRVTAATWVAFKVSVLVVDDEDGAFVSLANFKWNFDVGPNKGKSP